MRYNNIKSREERQKNVCAELGDLFERKVDNIEEVR